MELLVMGPPVARGLRVSWEPLQSGVCRQRPLGSWVSQCGDSGLEHHLVVVGRDFILIQGSLGESVRLSSGGGGAWASPDRPRRPLSSPAGT